MADSDQKVDTIEINGRRTVFDASRTQMLSDLIHDLGHHGRRGIAVAINDEVIPKSAWPQTTLAAGDRVEVVVAVQGG